MWHRVDMNYETIAAKKYIESYALRSFICGNWICACVCHLSQHTDITCQCEPFVIENARVDKVLGHFNSTHGTSSLSRFDMRIGFFSVTFWPSYRLPLLVVDICPITLGHGRRGGIREKGVTGDMVRERNRSTLYLNFDSTTFRRIKHRRRGDGDSRMCKWKESWEMLGNPLGFSLW